MTKNRIKFDERFIGIFKSSCTRLYILTLLGIWADIIIRSLVLKQPSSRYEDLSIIMTLNIVAILGILFFNSGIKVKKIKASQLALLYIGFVSAGVVFTTIKYRIYNLNFIFDKFVIIASIFAIFFAIYIAISYIGEIKANRELEE